MGRPKNAEKTSVTKSTKLTIDAATDDQLLEELERRSNQSELSKLEKHLDNVHDDTITEARKRNLVDLLDDTKSDVEELLAVAGAVYLRKHFESDMDKVHKAEKSGYVLGGDESSTIENLPPVADIPVSV